MPIELKIPQISEGVDSATISEILVSEGDKIEKEDAILTLETDKASADVPASEGGTVKEIKVSEGDEVNVGDVVMILSGDDDSDDENDAEEESEKRDKGEDEESDSSKEETDDSDSKEDVKENKKEKEDKKEDREKKEQENEKKTEEDQKAKEEPKSEKSEKTDDEESDDEEPSGEGSEIPASPKVRRLARERGIDLNSVKGTGSDGRILEEDLEGEEPETQKSEKKEKTSSEQNNEGPVVREELSQIRLTTAKRTQEAWTEIPHVFQFDETDISKVEEFIDKYQEKEKAKLTITSIAVKIAASALIRFPKFNASIDMEKKEVVYKKYINIGVAVDTPKGLLVPVLRNAEQKNLFEIAEELTDLAEKARNGELTPDEMKGGTFTISNLGGIGGTSFTPIILKPQVAILGLSRAEVKPFHDNGEWIEKTILPLSLSYDHRLIDGAEGAKFISFISKALADPFRAMMGV